MINRASILLISELFQWLINSRIHSEATRAEAGGIWKPRYILGIDLGNYGLGMPVMDISGNVVDSGFVHVNSLINYIGKKTAESYCYHAATAI